VGDGRGDLNDAAKAGDFADRRNDPVRDGPFQPERVAHHHDPLSLQRRMALDCQSFDSRCRDFRAQQHKVAVIVRSQDAFDRKGFAFAVRCFHFGPRRAFDDMPVGDDLIRSDKKTRAPRAHRAPFVKRGD
jgi:hypothetical protein